MGRAAPKVCFFFFSPLMLQRLGPDVREGKRRQFNYIGSFLFLSSFVCCKDKPISCIINCMFLEFAFQFSVFSGTFTWLILTRLLLLCGMADCPCHDDVGYIVSLHYPTYTLEYN